MTDPVRKPITNPDLLLATRKGLLAGPKSKHIKTKVTPALFDAAAERLGTTSPSEVVAAALASVAVRYDLGTWLAENHGVLADLPPDVMELIDVW